MNKKFLFLVLLFLLTSSLFAQTSNSLVLNLSSWDMKELDNPLIDGIAYFLNTYSSFLSIAISFAIGLGILTICWTAFKLWLGTEQVRKACVDIGIKFMLYTALMSIYPLITKGLIETALYIGGTAGGGYFQVSEAFIKLQSGMKEQVAVAQQKLKNVFEDNTYNDEYMGPIDYGKAALSVEEAKRLSGKFGMSESELQQEMQALGVLIYSQADIDAARRTGLFGWVADIFAPSAQLRAIRDGKRNYENYKKTALEQAITKDEAYAMACLQAIKEVMVESDPLDPSDEGTVNKNTINYNPYIRNKDGSTSRYLSPGAMIKTAALIAEIMTKRDHKSYQPKGATMTERFFDGAWQSISALLLSVLMTIGLIAATIFFCVQYIMCIFEYFICTSLGVIFIPFVLWDGTKSFAAKLVTLFSAFFIKIIVMLLCVFWSFSAFIDMGVSMLSNPRPITLLDFAYFLFTLILTWVVTQNAPQIAVSILNGSPQLSMGEFLQAAGTAAAGAMLAKKAANTTGKIAKGTIQGGARIATGGTAELAGAKAFGKAFENESRGTQFKEGVKYLAGRAAGGIKNTIGGALTGTKQESATRVGSQLSQDSTMSATGKGKTVTAKDAKNNAVTMAQNAYNAKYPQENQAERPQNNAAPKEKQTKRKHNESKHDKNSNRGGGNNTA